MIALSSQPTKRTDRAPEAAIITILKAFLVLNVLGLIVVSVVFSADVQKHEDVHAGGLDTADIEKAMGAGEMKGDVYKISLPRKDLSVTVKA